MMVKTKGHSVLYAAALVLAALLFAQVAPSVAEAEESSLQDTTADAIVVAEAAGARYGAESDVLGAQSSARSLAIEGASASDTSVQPLAASTTDDGWAYTVSSGGGSVTLTGYTGASLTPAVPATVDGLPVTGAIVNAGAGAPSITSIDLSAVKGTLASLKVYGCALTSLDLSDCAQLTYVDVRSNKLTSLTLGSNVQLTTLFCSENRLSSIDLSKCVALVKLYCDNNKITALDVSKCSLLEYLDCHENRLTALSVGGNLKLTDLFCYNNYIVDDLYTLTQRFGTEQNVVLPQRSQEQAVWERLWGDTALDTMDTIVDKGWADGSCDAVVVAPADDWHDALAASGLAGLLDCPVITTSSSGLSDQTAKQIERLGAEKVYVVGGPAWISDDIKDQIADVAGVDSVERLSGAAARDTALAVLEAGKSIGDGWGATCVVATDGTYQDALAAAPYAYAKAAPVLLSDSSTQGLDSSTFAAVEGFEHAYVVGGSYWISDGALSALDAAKGDGFAVRLSGADACETSQAVATQCLADGMVAEGLGVATVNGYWDALAGASLCGRNGSVLLLVSDASSSTIGGFVADRAADISSGYVFGGPATVSAETLAALENATA